MGRAWVGVGGCWRFGGGLGDDTDDVIATVGHEVLLRLGDVACTFMSHLGGGGSDVAMVSVKLLHSHFEVRLSDIPILVIVV